MRGEGAQSRGSLESTASNPGCAPDALPRAGAARAPAPDHVAATSCPECVAAGRCEAPDPWSELADAARRRAGAEAIADHLGFCARHAAVLGAKPWPASLAPAAADGLGILAALLEDRPRYEEKLLQIMFRSRHACAACGAERRRTPIDPAALAGDAARRLCFPHYRAAAAKADEKQLALLAAGVLHSARAWQERLEDAAGTDEDATSAALHWLAGEEGIEAPGALPLQSGSPCPVCRAAARALQRWLDAACTALRLDLELRGLLPLCPAHIGAFALHAGARDAREVARQATEVIAAMLERGLAENARAARREVEESASVWYRRRAASYLLGRRRRALRMPACGACERVDVACQQAQGETLDLLASRAGREELAGQGDLCVRHFAGVYMFAPHGEPRMMLAARQRAALLRAQAALAGGGSGDEWMIAASQLGDPGAWR